LGSGLRQCEAGDLVGRCASLAALLEVSSYPKPGNVHRARDFPDTRYEHFLAGGVALGTAMRSLAMRGFDAEERKIGWEDVGVGRLAFKAVNDSLVWQGGGNVNLGVALLFSPLSAAGGAVLHDDEAIEASALRSKLKEVLHSTTPDDVVHVYEAIRLAMTPRTLGEAEELDVRDDASLERIRDEGLTLLDVFRCCAGRDSICDEWVSDFEITFEIGHPYLKESLEESVDINSSMVNTFLYILARQPDSLIARKVGQRRAAEVSERARLILDEGGSGSERGLEMLWELDRDLQEAGGKLNPGTTADMTAASIFIVLLEGWRP
jgi:triphosphoribosyl-dephospho-CoA synthase